MSWRRTLSYITGSVDRELLLRNEYLATENRILRAQLEGKVPLNDGEHRSLAEIGKRLGRKALAEVATIVKPETFRCAMIVQDERADLLGRRRRLGPAAHPIAAEL